MLEVNFEFLLIWMQALILPLFRILGFVVIAPFFSEAAYPGFVKICTAMSLTVLLVGTGVPSPLIEITSLTGLFQIVIQTCIGLVMGFMLRIVFAVVDYAGQFMALLMGFGFATFYDIQAQTNNTSISTLLNTIALLVFVSVNGHLLVLSLLMQSLHAIPVGASFPEIDYRAVVTLSANIFSEGLKVALPLTAVILVVNIALAILVKAAPQLNLFVIGFVLTITVGLLTLYFMMLSTLEIHFLTLDANAVQALRQIFLPTKQ